MIILKHFNLQQNHSYDSVNISQELESFEILYDLTRNDNHEYGYTYLHNHSVLSIRLF